MQSEFTIKPKQSLEFVLNSHSSLFESHRLHSAFKVTDKIYTDEKEFLLNQLIEPPEKVPVKVKQNSMTPAPMRYYKEESSKSPSKEDLFLNPSALYLSKKPIAYNKTVRELQRKKNLSHYTPIPLLIHKKNKSTESVKVSHKLPVKLPRLPDLVPISEIKAISPRIKKNDPKQAQEVHCDALSKVTDFCNSFQRYPAPMISREKKIVLKYSEKTQWISEILQEYGEYDSKILKELYKYSNERRNELECERAGIVHLMKTGVLDPNKNIVKLRSKLKKHKEKP